MHNHNNLLCTITSGTGLCCWRNAIRRKRWDDTWKS